MGFMAEEGQYMSRDVEEALRYVWCNSGSYMLCIWASVLPIVHAVAYSDRSSWPFGFLLNQNTGAHCCHTYAGLIDVLRSDKLSRFYDLGGSGVNIVVFRMGEPDGTRCAARSAHPSVRFARELQEYPVHRAKRVPQSVLPRAGLHADEGRSVYSDVDAGQIYVWHNPEGYILLIHARNARVGHAVAYSDRYY